MNTMEYKGYVGSAEFDMEGDALVGKLLFLRDTITYSSAVSAGAAGLRAAFEEAVDDYLCACQELGDEPDQPCKGSFNVRVGEERHLAAAIGARQQGVSLNEYVCRALDSIKAQKQDHSTHNHIGSITVQLSPGESQMIFSTASPTSRNISRATAH